MRILPTAVRTSDWIYSGPLARHATKNGILGAAAICFLAWSITAWGASSPSGCDPNRAPEVRSVTVENSEQEDLQDYAVAVTLNRTNFDFAIPSKDGSDLAAWDAATHQPMAAWLESYDPAASKGLLWVKLPNLDAQTSLSFLLTAGRSPGCSPPIFSGYTVFPFFSDVHDVLNWQASNELSVSDSVVESPLTIYDRSVIESDGRYNNTPSVVRASNGDLVLSYNTGVGHSNSPFVILRRSRDGGATWSPEVVYFNSSKPDPGLARTPLGDLLIALVKADQSSDAGGAYSRSNDNGLTWEPFTFFDNPPTKTFIVDPLLNIGSTMYGAGYGLYAGGTGYAPSVWSSSDDGYTWTELSELREPNDPGLNETALAQTAPNTLFAMMRSDDNVDTFGRYSTDLGMTWGPLISYTSQVGALQDPEMIQAGRALILMGREATAIPGVQPSNTLGYPRQLVAFVSYDAGQTFRYGTVLDTYTGQTIDGGYSWPILVHSETEPQSPVEGATRGPCGPSEFLCPENPEVYVVYYADSHNLGQPDIKSLRLSVGPPFATPTSSLHIVSRLAPGLATHGLSLNTTRYSLEFRFRSSPTPAGSQFSVVLRGQSSGSPVNLVNWELPSTHATDPTSDSGIISNGEFAQVWNSFSYGQAYRLRTVVDETQETQQASLLDEFGGLISATAPLPLAQASAHASAVQIGNNSSLRATDTLLDFVFVRPAAQTEPTVVVSSGH
ncbi:MAG TPA: DUF2341 domain-containing protein [Candidatus Sulfotelmatobacter sp.]|nr:DUF2341 domain-containing protein [Candidatus Sulfotelmatobacter sp.]